MTTTRAHGVGRLLTGIMGLLLTFYVTASETAPLPPEDAEAWSLRKEMDNVRVYTMELEGSGFEAFKAVAELDVPIENLMAVMVNPESCEEWVHNCTESYAFGQGNFHDRYAYSVNDMPWPVTDRDYVLRIRTRGDASTGEIVMDLNAVPNMRAELNSRVRVNRSDTLYRFTPKGARTRMVWVQHTDPNGALPGWLVNSLIVDIPVKSMKALEKVAKQDRYQGFQLQWNEDGTLQGVTPKTH